jgi:hypothetical protein
VATVAIAACLIWELRVEDGRYMGIMSRRREYRVFVHSYMLGKRFLTTRSMQANLERSRIASLARRGD